MATVTLQSPVSLHHKLFVIVFPAKVAYNVLCYGMIWFSITTSSWWDIKTEASMAKVSYGRPLPNWIFPDGVNLLSNPSFSQSRFLVAMVMIIGGMNLKCCIRRRSEWGKFGGLTGGESNKGTKEGAAEEKETYFDFKTRIWASGGNQKCELLLQI